VRRDCRLAIDGSGARRTERIRGVVHLGRASKCKPYDGMEGMFAACRGEMEKHWGQDREKDE